jgi:hypothetical protein
MDLELWIRESAITTSHTTASPMQRSVFGATHCRLHPTLMELAQRFPHRRRCARNMRSLVGSNAAAVRID